MAFLFERIGLEIEAEQATAGPKAEGRPQARAFPSRLAVGQGHQQIRDNLGWQGPEGRAGMVSLA
jgi:hypothetical protein